MNRMRIEFPSESAVTLGINGIINTSIGWVFWEVDDNKDEAEGRGELTNKQHQKGFQQEGCFRTPPEASAVSFGCTMAISLAGESCFMGGRF